MEIPCFGWGFSRHAGLPAVVHRPCSENLSSWLPQLIESKRPRISRFQCSRNRCFLRYNVPARRAFCPCARLLRFNSETNLVQRQFAFLHFPKAWWEASGWSQLSQGVARCTFRFWLRVCFLSCSAIGASPFREPGYLTDHRTEEPRRHHLRQPFRVRHGTNLHPKTQLDNPAIPSNRRGDNERKRGTLKTGSFLHFALVFLRSVCPLQLNYVG